jgi:hypothetical protein
LVGAVMNGSFVLRGKVSKSDVITPR